MKFKLKSMIISAALIAVAAALSNVKLFSMPSGGSATLLSMLFASAPGFLFGWKLGILSGVVYGLVQFALGPYIVHPAQVVLDYFFAFGALGFTGFFTAGKHRLQIGYAVAVLGRFFFSALSGFIFYSDMGLSFMENIIATVTYNGGYMGAEMIITLILISIPVFKSFLERLEKQAVSEN
jgi:thiamine transporter